MNRKVAIVLRGAPGTGKTTISNALRQHFSQSRSALIVLDEGWASGEKRFSERTRYGDLSGQPEVLIIELGYGEPVGETFPGATKNPREWLSSLEQEGREVFFFMLYIERSECIRRVTARGSMRPAYAVMAWDRYAPGGTCSSTAFSSRVGSSCVETTVSTQDSDPAAAVAQIVQAVGAVG